MVKNLVVGYVVADTSKKGEVLKIIATVLDFNEDERSKTGLGQGLSAQGWLQSWFGSSATGASGHSTIGHRRTTSGEVHAATGLDLGLAQAFVKFLETESKPKAPPLQVNICTLLYLSYIKIFSEFWRAHLIEDYNWQCLLI